MKHFLCVNLSEDTNKSYTEAEAFIATTTSGENLSRYRTACDEHTAILQGAKLPTGLAIVRLILFSQLAALTLCLVFGLFIKGYSSEPVETIIFTILSYSGLCTGLYFIERFRKRRQDAAATGEEATAKRQEITVISNDILKEHGAPDSATFVDILTFHYETSKKSSDAGAENIRIFERQNPVFAIFVSDNCLCLSYYEAVYSIPLDSLRRIRTVNEHFGLDTWNKQLSFEDEFFKNTGVATYHYGVPYAQRYHILEFEHNNEIWGIYFPCYELSSFEKLTGITAESNQ